MVFKKAFFFSGLWTFYNTRKFSGETGWFMFKLHVLLYNFHINTLYKNYFIELIELKILYLSNFTQTESLKHWFDRLGARVQESIRSSSPCAKRKKRYMHVNGFLHLPLSFLLILMKSLKKKCVKVLHILLRSRSNSLCPLLCKSQLAFYFDVPF